MSESETTKSESDFSDFNNAFQNAAHCYNILKNAKAQCFQNQTDLKSEDVQRAVTFAAAALNRDSALCDAQYAVFSVFKTFEFETFRKLPGDFTTNTECAKIIHTVLQTFLRNIELLKISDQASFNQLKHIVVKSYPTFLEKTQDGLSFEQLKRYESLFVFKDDTGAEITPDKMRQKRCGSIKTDSDKKHCINGITNLNDALIGAQKEIRKYTKCDKSGGGKKSKKSKRSRKQTRRRRRLRKHKK